MSQNVGLSLYRNFVQPHRGQVDVQADENEQARFAKGVGGKRELTSHDVPGANSALGRGLERVGRAVGSALRFLGRVFTLGHVQPPHKNWEVRQAFKNAICAHLQRHCDYSPVTDTGLEADLPKSILDAFKDELNSNKPLTKRRIRAVLAEVDKYVQNNPKKEKSQPKVEPQSKPEPKPEPKPKSTGVVAGIEADIQDTKAKIDNLTKSISGRAMLDDDPTLEKLRHNLSKAEAELKALEQKLEQAKVENKPVEQLESHPYKPINNRDEVLKLLKSMKTAKSGKVVVGGKHADINGVERQLYTYQGLVFRSDRRNFSDKSLNNGFESWNNLDEKERLIEAMGLGAVGDQGKKGAFGATGSSGVSCAKTIGNCINYASNEGSCLYIIDTTKIGDRNSAWDMSNIVLKNDLSERDETGEEVNVSQVPREAVVGYVKLSNEMMNMPNADAKMERLLLEIEQDESIVVFTGDKA